MLLLCPLKYSNLGCLTWSIASYGFESVRFARIFDYGDPDEILLGDGNNFSIFHTGYTHINTAHKLLSISNVLCVPNLRKNLISMVKLYKTNHIFVELFSSHFLVRDPCTGTPLMWRENIDDIYCVAILKCP